MHRTWNVMDEGAVTFSGGLSAGTYILTIEADGNTWNQRVVVTQ